MPTLYVSADFRVRLSHNKHFGMSRLVQALWDVKICKGFVGVRRADIHESTRVRFTLLIELSEFCHILWQIDGASVGLSQLTNLPLEERKRDRAWSTMPVHDRPNVNLCRLSLISFPRILVDCLGSWQAFGWALCFFQTSCIV